MALRYHPRLREILLCDYEGFKVPEMVKRRPVVVVSPRLRRRDNLCAVVPLSTKEPNQIEDYHYRLEFDRPLPSPWGSPIVWVKADMLATVGLYRLHQIGTGRDQEGKRKYLRTRLTEDELAEIRTCMLNALGLGHLTEHL